MSYKVSVIVPVYNVSSYIERCARSLFNQTLREIEYIFVNDATPDDSMEKLSVVIAEYPHRQSDIKIINHTENQGTSIAKGTAIQISFGEYISIVDSDDYIEPDMMESLYRKAVDENAEIVVSDMILEYKNSSVLVEDCLSENSDDHLKDIIENERTLSFLCGKLILSTLYKNPDCVLPEGLNYYEDRHVTTRLYYYAKKIVKIKKAFYHYTQYNTNSITKNKTKMHFENVLLFWNLLDEFLETHNEYEKHKDITNKSKIQNKVQLMLETHYPYLRKEYANMFLEEEKTVNLKNFRRGERIMLFLVRHKWFYFAHLFHVILFIKNGK